MNSPHMRLVAAAFILEIFLAGGNGVAIRFSNRELAPIWGASLRFILASVLMITILFVLKKDFPRGRPLLWAILFGIFQFAGAFGFAYFALVELHAGLGQTLLALVPLATLLLAVAQRQERLRGAAVVGTLLGAAGIGLVTLDPGRDPLPLFPVLAALASVLCFAQALVIARRMPSVHPVSLNAAGMVSGAIVLSSVSILLGEPISLPRRTETWTALAYVVAIGSAAVFLLHVFIVQNWTASRASYVMVLIPLVTLTLSAWLDEEPITGGLLLGGALVLIGVYVGALRELPSGSEHLGNH